VLTNRKEYGKDPRSSLAYSSPDGDNLAEQKGSLKLLKVIGDVHITLPANSKLDGNEKLINPKAVIQLAKS
jgi:hypothetical protein